MARATKRKAVEAAATERAGKRRRETDDEGLMLAKQPRKEQKPFRFLELPGELRNRIYVLAFGVTYRTFPTSSFRKEHGRRCRQVRAFGVPTHPSPPIHPIPFWGLAQSCSLIRSEFRGWWMGAHMIPLCALDRYLSVFFPPPPTNGQGRKRFDSYYNSSGLLRIFLRHSELFHRDFLRLAKHKVRFPNFTVRFEHLFELVSADEAKGLEELVNNTHTAWVRWVRANVVSQIRVEPPLPPISPMSQVKHLTIVLVIKEKYAPVWMRSCRSGPVGYLASMGLDKVSHWSFAFAVDYS